MSWQRRLRGRVPLRGLVGLPIVIGVALTSNVASAQTTLDGPEEVIRQFFDHLARLEADSALALTASDFMLGEGPAALDRDQLRALIENATTTTVSVRILDFAAATGADSTLTATYRREVRVRPEPDAPISVRTTYETATLRLVAAHWLIVRLLSETG